MKMANTVNVDDDGAFENTERRLTTMSEAISFRLVRSRWAFAASLAGTLFAASNAHAAPEEGAAPVLVAQAATAPTTTTTTTTAAAQPDTSPAGTTNPSNGLTPQSAPSGTPGTPEDPNHPKEYNLSGPKIDSGPPSLFPATPPGDTSIQAQQAANNPGDEDLKKFKSRYEPLRVKGWNVNFPLPDQTLTGDNAVRQTLADNHLGFYFYGIAFAGVNMLDTARSGPNGAQLYNGQKFTTRTTPSGIINYDLSWLGLENAQLSGAFCFVTTTWDPAGPNEFQMSHLTYYQSLFHKTLELKVGYLTNNFEFYGPYVGGNLASALFGQSASVLTAMGLSHTVAPRPGANLQLNVGNYYEKSGIQYSSSPDGFSQEQNENGTGFQLQINNAHTLFIQEVGYKTAATKTTRSNWARFGWIRNTSDFVDYQFGGRSTKNYAFYGMADYQWLKFKGHGSEAAGLYLGYSAHLGLDRYSRIAQTYEGRIYTMGPLKGRPGDMASMIVDYNSFSVYAIEAAKKAGTPTVPSNWVATWAYNAAIVPGLTAGLALSYSDHPSPVVNPPGTGHALQALTSFTFYL